MGEIQGFSGPDAGRAQTMPRKMQSTESRGERAWARALHSAVDRAIEFTDHPREDIAHVVERSMVTLAEEELSAPAS